MLDIKALRREAKAAGVYERREAQTWLKFFFLLSVMGSLITAQVLAPTWAALLLVPVTAWFATAAVMIGHEGGHRALSKSNARNNLMLYMAFPLFSGLGAHYWKYKHNVKHHAYPNVEGEDTDIKMWPMACTREAYDESPRLQQWFQRNFQGYAFWPLTCLLPVSMRGSSIAYLYRRVRDRGVDHEVIKDTLCLLSHYTLWIVVPSFFVGFWTALGFWFITWAVVGVYLAMIFAPAHMGLPIYTGHEDPWRLQLETTRNLRLPRWLSFFFIGLDYQVEHHLFPRVPHQNMRLARDVTRAWAERNGVEHLEIDYWDALKDVTRFMHEGWDYRPITPESTSAEPELAKAA